MYQALDLQIRPQVPEVATWISKEYTLHPVAARILASRGVITEDEVRTFLYPTFKSGLPEPCTLRDAKKACVLLKEVRNERSHVAIFCDFDVDGLSGGSQMVNFCKEVNIPWKAYVPDRFTDGYGLSCDLVERAYHEGCRTLLTIDFGTKNGIELAFARKLGMTTIVIDHHHVGDLVVDVDAFINPLHPECNFAGGILCASGVVWFFLLALRRELSSDASHIDMKEYLALASLGTICDMVPLRGVNRLIVRRGLESLSRSSRPGLKKLKEALNLHKAITCTEVGFQIGPRLNAAGRMANGAIVLDLLTTDSENEATILAQRLIKLNQDRKLEEERVRDKARKQVESMSKLPEGLFLWGDDYHLGVIGIVAQRMVESYKRPCAVAGLDKDDIFKGSVRGVHGFNVVEALEKSSKHLLKFGGHKGAGGFAVHRSHLKEFAISFIEDCIRQKEVNCFSQRIDVDTKVTFEEISFSLVTDLEKLAPFGAENPSPLLLSESVQVSEIRVLKGAHLRITFSDGPHSLVCMAWNGVKKFEVQKGDNCSIVYQLKIDSYEGITTLRGNLITLNCVSAAKNGN
jgi:single-stranded-DNA-specific exonuclease